MNQKTNPEQAISDIMQPLMMHAGSALFTCQHFEHSLALILYYFSRTGETDLRPEMLRDVLDQRTKKTTGGPITMIKTHLDACANVEALLADALDARNSIVHRSMVETAEDLGTPEGRKSTIDNIRRLRAIVHNANQVLNPFICTLMEELDGVDMSNLMAKLPYSFAKGAEAADKDTV